MFSKCNQAVNVIFGNIGVVVNQLAELRFQTITEEAYCVLVSEFSQVAMVSREQGYVFIDRTFLLQVFDLVKGVFSVIGINETLMEFEYE